MLRIEKVGNTEFYHYEPPYAQNERELRLPNLYGDPKRIRLEFIPEPQDKNVIPWTGVYGGDSVKLPVGTKFRIINMEPYRMILEIILWTLKAGGTLDYEFSPPPGPPPTPLPAEHP